MSKSDSLPKKKCAKPRGIVKTAPDYRYSEKVAGAPSNYRLAVAFDVIGNHVAIWQFDGEKMPHRVLLTAAQYKRLVEFVETGK